MNKIKSSPDEGFTFAYRVLNKDTGKEITDKEYIQVEIIQNTLTWLGGSPISFLDGQSESTQVPIVEAPCTKYQIAGDKNISQDVFQRLKLSKFRCPQNKTYSIRGQLTDNPFSFLTLSFKKCIESKAQPQVKCKPLSEIDTVVDNLQIQFIFLNANFDHSDINEPIKQVLVSNISSNGRYYIDKRLFEGMTKNFMKSYDIFVQQNQASLQDDFFQMVDSNPINYYETNQIEKHFSNYNQTTGELMRFSLYTSSINHLYQRRIFSLTDVFAQMGGVYSSLYTIGFVFCAAFSYNLMMASLIRKVYHFRPRFQCELKSSKKYNQKQKDKFKQGDAGRDSDQGESGFGARQPLSQTDYVERAVDRQQAVTEIKDHINEVMGMNKVHFNYKTTSILKSLLCCLGFRKRSTLRKYPRHRNVLYFQKGFERLDKELDLSYVIKSNRNIKQLKRLLLDKDQRRLLQLKQTELVSSDDERPIKWDFKKQLLKSKLVGIYVDHLRIKALSQTDVKLLKTNGLGKVLHIVSQANQRAQSQDLRKKNKGYTDLIQLKDQSSSKGNHQNIARTPFMNQIRNQRKNLVERDWYSQVFQNESSQESSKIRQPPEWSPQINKTYQEDSKTELFTSGSNAKRSRRQDSIPSDNQSNTQSLLHQRYMKQDIQQQTAYPFSQEHELYTLLKNTNSPLQNQYKSNCDEELKSDQNITPVQKQYSSRSRKKQHQISKPYFIDK